MEKTMCQYLDPACFMANVFAVCSDRKTFSLPMLREMRDYVSDSLAAQNVVIEWTRDAVMGALESYPNVFGYHGQEVEWLAAADRNTVRRSFDAGFPDEFVNMLSQTIKESPMRRDRAIA
jgi:hypothetical protein